MNQPIINIQFSEASKLNGEVLSIWIRSLNDAIKAARGNKEDLLELDRLVKEAGWLIDNYQAELVFGKFEKSEAVAA